MTRMPTTEDENLRNVIILNPKLYLIIGDTDKPFHRPECECSICENWRKDNNRPTHQELRDATSKQGLSDGNQDTTNERDREHT